MQISEVKQRFLEHFKRDGYAALGSDPLVTEALPTTFVTSAGLRDKPPTYCLVQRCLRTYDAARVGYEDRLCFFEMGGAVSVQQRDESDVLASLVSFLGDVAGLSPGRLWCSIFSGGDVLGGTVPSDDASRDTLRKLGVGWAPELGSKNWFGNTLQRDYCGPTVEVFYDRGSCGRCPNPQQCPSRCPSRYVEVATCVLLRYQKRVGELAPLGRTITELAVGVERLALVTSGLPTIGDLPPLCEIRDSFVSRGLTAAGAARRAADVCADHLRALLFAVADGAMPGPRGRGHEVRKLMRRLFVRLEPWDERVAREVAALLRLTATLNRGVLPLRPEQVEAVSDVVRSEGDLFARQVKVGTINPRHYADGVTHDPPRVAGTD